MVRRRDALRGAESSVKRAEAAGVTILRSSVLESLRGGEQVEWAGIRELMTDQARDVPYALAILALGFAADLSLLQAWDLPLDRRRLNVAPDAMAAAPGFMLPGM